MKTLFFKTINRHSVMESETISKNEASPKSHTIRRNPVIILFATAFVLLAIFTIATCSSSPSSSASSSQSVTVNKNLIGLWEGEQYNQNFGFVFFDNGTFCGGRYGRGVGKYSIYDNLLMMSRVGRDGEYHDLYTYNISGNTLTLSAYGDTSEQSKITLKKVK